MTESDIRFLVIDDDETFNRILCRSLSRRGYQSFSALNGMQAIEQLKLEAIDQVVLDLRLADESGISLIQPMLELQPNLRILVLTGYASLTTAVQAIKLGAWNYLAKPVDIDAILKAFELEAGQELSVEDLQPTSLKQMEWEHLQRVLDENNGNISATARQLGMHRRTLQRKLQKKVSPNTH